MGEKVAFRARNPEQTKAGILAAAQQEFARLGLAGGRVESIAEAAGANKRMIYHYFGGKEQLFEAVVEDAYARLRDSESQLGLEDLPPADALRKLVAFSWQYGLQNPEFITLINSANLHQGRHLAGKAQLRKLHRAYVKAVDSVLRRGVASGVFREGIDASQLCVTIDAIGHHYLATRHTGTLLYGFNFGSRDALAKRLEFNVETVLRMVLKKPK